MSSWIARHGLSPADYQATFSALTQEGYRLIQVSGYVIDGQERYAALWDKSSGPLWSARHGVPHSWYQNAFDNHYYQGYHPRYVQAFTSGSSARVNFIMDNTAMAGADLGLISSRANDYLKSHDVPAVALAITKDGRLVYAAAFGLADQSAKIEAGPTSLFRIASVSKPITSVAIWKLIEANKVALDDKVFGPGSILGAKYPTPAGNQKIDKITVRHLLQHVSGLSNTGGDPMFMNTTLNHDDLIKNVINDPNRALTREPGAQYEYLNFGYCLLGRVIEQRSGKSYEEFVRQSVLQPCGITNMVIGANTAAAHRPREVVYHPSSAYSLNVTRFDAHGGWIASPIDLCRLMVRVDGLATKSDILSAASRTSMTTKAGVPDANGNDPHYAMGWAVNPQAHNGAMTGTIAILSAASGGYTFAAVANLRPADDSFAGQLTAMVKGIINDVSAWPAYDLF